jgi:hypothetical protein
LNGILTENEEIFPTIGLTLFFYAICPCCQDPTQRDCADSMTVGFSNLLKGGMKVRNLEFDDKKQKILDCKCAFHLRQLNEDIFRSNRHFMNYVLCPAIENSEFQNEAISNLTISVLKEAVGAHL